MFKTLSAAVLALSFAAAPAMADDVNSVELVEMGATEYSHEFGPGLSFAERVACDSWGYNYSYCPVGGRIAQVNLVRQVSKGRGRCIAGQTWGWDRGGIWVDNGCRGIFEVWRR